MKKIASLILPILTTFLALEAFLWIIPIFNFGITNKVTSYLNYDWPYSSQGWAYRYIKHNPKDLGLEDSMHYLPHPTRGWVFKPNLTLWIDGYKWTTNEFGHRSLHTPSATSSKSKIMVVGDSQTAGDEVDDIHAWPHMLSTFLNNYEVVNLSVSGYSLSQMLITAIEELDTWKPDSIIIATIGDDLYRSALTFRTAAMPELSHDETKPFVVKDMNNEDIKLKYFSKFNFSARSFKTVSLALSLYDRYHVYNNNKTKAYTINSLLLSQLITKTKDTNTKIIFSYLPYPYELNGQATDTMLSQYEALCAQYTSPTFVCKNVGEKMIGHLGDYRQGGGHYHRKGNETVARLMADTYIPSNTD